MGQSCMLRKISHSHLQHVFGNTRIGELKPCHGVYWICFWGFAKTKCPNKTYQTTISFYEAAVAEEVFDLGTGLIGFDYLFFRHSFYTGNTERTGKKPAGKRWLLLKVMTRKR